MSAVAPLVPNPVRAHVALVGLAAEVGEFLRVCLLQMGIESFVLADGVDIARRKFEGFVVDLRDADAPTLLERLRKSERNRRAVIFGIYSDAHELRRFSVYGINAVIQWPAKRPEAIKVLRSAQTLLVHELRRYARIPLATEIELTIHQEKFSGVSREVSGGGMSINFSRSLKGAVGEFVELAFVIPPGKNIVVKGVLCWKQESDTLIGIQFLSEPEPLKPIRAWIDDYLGIS